MGSRRLDDAAARSGGPGPRPPVGRTGHAETFTDVLDAGTGFGGGAFLLEGAGGAGKTALLSWLRAAADERGWTVFEGRAGRHVTEPYGPFRRAFADDPGGEGVLSHLDGGDDTDDPETFAARRNVGFHDFVDEVLALSTIDPVLVTVDDLQWADPSTVELLAYFAETLAEVDYPVVLVGACRPAETGARFGRFRETARTMAVGPLDAADTEALLADLVGDEGAAAASLPDGFVDLVQSTAGGNPLFVEALVAALRADGRLDPAADRYPGADATVPSTVDAAVERWVADLDEPTTDVLRAGAVLDSPSTVDALAAVADRDPSTVTAAVETLVDRGLWRDPARPAFVTERVRDAVLGGLPGVERRRLHGRAAEHFAAGGGATADDDPADDEWTVAAVAGHTLAAGDRERALARLVALADRAEGRFAAETAVAVCERALVLAERLDREAQVATLLVRIGTNYLVLGAYDEAVDHLRRGRERADDPDRWCRAARLESAAARHDGDLARAVACAETGLEHAADRDVAPGARGRLLNEKGQALEQQGDLQAARAVFSQQVDAAPDAASRALALRNLGNVERKTGALGTARELLEEADELAADEPAAERHTVLRKLGIVVAKSGDVESSVDTYREELQLVREADAVDVLPNTLMNLATAYYRQGDLEQAARRLETAVEMAERVGNEDIHGMAIGNRGKFLLDTGRLDDAVDELERAIGVLEAVGNQDRVAFRRATLAEAGFLRGDYGRAATLVDEAVETARETAHQYTIGFCLKVRGRVRAATGDTAAAIDDHEEAAAVLGEHGNDRHEADALARLGMDYLAAGDVDGAVETARRALDTVDDAEVLIAARARARLGAAHRAAGDLDAADEALGAAAATQRDCGAVTELCWSLVEHAKVQRDRGDGDHAAASLAEARELAAERGLNHLLDRVVEVERSL